MPLIKNKSDIEETVSIYESLRQSYIENGYREYIFVKNGNLYRFFRHNLFFRIFICSSEKFRETYCKIFVILI